MQNVTNIDVIENNKPLTELDLTPLARSVKAICIWKNKIDELRFMNTPVTVVPSITPAAMDPTKTVPVAKEAQAPTAAPAPGKGNPAPTPRQDPKKQRLNQADSRPPSERGLFHMPPPGLPAKELFPAGLKKTPCMNFSCQGRVCAKPRTTCPWLHAVMWKDLKEDGDKILAHFATHKKAWLDATTIRAQNITIPAEYQHLLGDANGPKST